MDGGSAVDGDKLVEELLARGGGCEGWRGSWGREGRASSARDASGRRPPRACVSFVWSVGCSARSMRLSSAETTPGRMPLRTWILTAPTNSFVPSSSTPCASSDAMWSTSAVAMLTLDTLSSIAREMWMGRMSSTCSAEQTKDTSSTSMPSFGAVPPGATDELSSPSCSPVHLSFFMASSNVGSLMSSDGIEKVARQSHERSPLVCSHAGALGNAPALASSASTTAARSSRRIFALRAVLAPAKTHTTLNRKPRAACNRRRRPAPGQAQSDPTVPLPPAACATLALRQSR